MKRIYSIFFIVFLFSSSVVFSLLPELKWNNQGEASATNSYMFSIDGKYIYTHYSMRKAAVLSNTLQKWDIESKKLENETTTNLQFYRMVLSNDGKSVVGADRNSKYIQLVDLITGGLKYITDISATDLQPVSTIAYSEDGKKVYVYQNSVKLLQIFDANTTLKVDSIHLNNVTYQVKFSTDGKYAGILNGDSTFSIYNMTDKTELYKIKSSLRNYSFCNVFINSDYFIINYQKTVTPDNIEIYSMKTGKIITKAQSAFEYPASIILNDNRTILTASYPNGIVEKYDMTTNVTTPTIISANGYQMIGSPAANILAFSDSLNNLLMFDVPTEKPIFSLYRYTSNPYRCSKVAISPDNKSVYAAGMKSADSLKVGQIIEYDFETGNIKNVYPVSDFFPTDMVLSNDGKILCTADSTGKIQVLSNFHETNFTRKSYDLKKNINSLAISEDNTKLIAGGYMTGFYYINLKTDSIHYDFQDPYKILELDPNLKTIALNKKGNKLIIAGKKKYIFVFNYNSATDKFEKVKDFVGDESESLSNEGVVNVSFSYDGKYILSSACDGYIHIFGSDNYKEVTKFLQNPDSVQYFPTSAVITQNNKKVVAGDNYPGLSIYDFNTGNKLWSKRFEEIKYLRFNSITVSDDNQYMAYCLNDGSLGLYKIDDNTDVKDNSNNSAKSISPNPARDYIEISSINSMLKNGVDEGSDIQIFNTLGEIIFSVEQTSQSVQKINISNLTSGMYFIKIGNNVEKFVKM